jgi:hypothetical protein
MTEIMHFQEECGCGAKLALRVSDEKIIEITQAAALWRDSHACSRRLSNHPSRGLGDWREGYVGMQCTVCTGPLLAAAVLTTVNGRPIHIECRRCSVCRKTKPHQMKWASNYVQVDMDSIVHPPCGKKLAEQDGQPAITVSSEPSSEEIEEVPIGETDTP